MDVSPDRASYPYRTGHGRPLEPPTNSSMRNPQYATRSMGVAETSPSIPRRDGEGALKTRRRARPDCLERAQARGLDARLHLLACTGCEQCQSRVRHRSRLKHRRCRLKYAPRPLTRFHGKTPAGAPTLLQGFGGYTRGSADTAPRKALATRGEGCPISRFRHLREPGRHARRCSGATVGDSLEGPLKQPGESCLKPAKNRNKTSLT
jgi:hypothetical protein